MIRGAPRRPGWGLRNRKDVLRDSEIMFPDAVHDLFSEQSGFPILEMNVISISVGPISVLAGWKEHIDVGCRRRTDDVENIYALGVQINHRHIQLRSQLSHGLRISPH